MNIIQFLKENQDIEYRDFQAKLIPTIEKEKIIGVRVPVLRKYAREIAKDKDIDAFLNDLPHTYLEENHLHMMIIGMIKDFDECLSQVEKFLPYIDNWATCDAGAPKVFARHTDELYQHVKRWIKSGRTYTIRYGTGMLMRLYLDEKFKSEYCDVAAKIRSDEYYVNMMTAWYFATALAKQYDTAVKYIEDKKLDEWTHNKAIQKACESYRVAPEQKMYLKSLKINSGMRG